MKSLWICVLIMVNLVSCVSKSSDAWMCSPDGQVCVYVGANEPILYGGTAIVTVTVTSERDIPDLGVSLKYDSDIVMEGVESWEENLQNPMVYTGGAGWEVAINANQTLTFTRTLHLPPREGHFSIFTAIGDEQSFRAANMLTIVLNSQGGTVYLANTPIPITSGRLPTVEPNVLETLQSMPTWTPWPTLTPIPTRTSTPVPQAYPPPASPTVPWDNPGEVPYP